ncbi:hypothetical protein DPSP01_001295 [Paraphaeosphaeria sporulosa]
MIDDDTGRKFCEKHEPASEISEVLDWKARMAEWLTSVALAELPREHDSNLPEDVGNEGYSAISKPEGNRDSEPEHHVEIDAGPEGKPDTESDTEPKTYPMPTTQDAEPTPKHSYTASKFNTEQEQDQEPRYESGPTPEQKSDQEFGQEFGQEFDKDFGSESTREFAFESDQNPEQKPEYELVLLFQNEHIAALYKQCNICLESHDAADMKKIASCGHQYRESCLQDFPRRKGVRRYNCAGCRTWLQSHQEP